MSLFASLLRCGAVRLVFVGFSLVAPACSQQTLQLPQLTPQPYRPALSDFRISASEVLPEVDSAQHVVFSDTISAIPDGEGIEKITAPPLTASLHQHVGVCDRETGQCIANGKPSHSFELIGTPSATWEPGQWTASLDGQLLSSQSSKPH